MILLYILGFVVVWVACAALVTIRKEKRRQAARREFNELIDRHGYQHARDLCPHRITTFGQTGIPGAVTCTTKWCAVCGKYLGPAKLKTSIFGNHWE